VLLALSVILIATTAPGSHVPRIPGIVVSADDCFASDCQPNKNTCAPTGIHNWVSWRNFDSGTGKLLLGPFVAPKTISLAVVGFPNKSGNRLYIERILTEEMQEIEEAGSENWHEIAVTVPDQWVGREIRLVAIDNATGLQGWFGISEPYDPDKHFLGSSWAKALRAFGVLWLLLIGLWAITIQLPICRALDDQARPLAGLAIIFLCSYALFWLYFLHPLAGYAGSLVLTATAAVGWLLIIRQCNARVAYDIVAPTALAGLIGLFSVSLLTVAQSPMSIPDLARHRFSPGLPPDNLIPGLFADRLYAGQSPKLILGDWLSSDRPPLQTGWILLSRPLCEWLNVSLEASTYVSGVVAQLAWVPATWWAVRWLGLPAGTAGFLCAMFAATGFFLQNTVFVWPKLMSASMAIGAGLLLLDDEDHSAPRHLRWIWAAAFAAIATLAHGGAWFSNLALIPLFCARQPWRHPRTVGVACAIAASIILPWMAYQKLYEPPGDRLLKMHLAGQSQPDERPLSVVIAEAYGKQSWAEVFDIRLQNLRTQLRGNYEGLGDSGSEFIIRRRRDEFFYSFRAVGWWNIGWLLYPYAIYLASKSTPFLPFLRRWNRIALWSAATFAVWIGLLYAPNTASIHHGSLALEIFLFVLPAALLASTSPGLLIATSVLAAGVFMSTWVPVEPSLGASAYLRPAALVALASWIVAVGLSNPCCGPKGVRAITGTEP